MALRQRLYPQREHVLPFLMLAYPACWLLLGRLCPLPTGARTDCFTLAPGRYVGYIFAALVGSYLLSVVLVATLAGRADVLGRPFTARPSTRALVLTAVLTAAFWSVRVLSAFDVPPAYVNLLLVPLGLPVMVIWVGMIAVGNAVGEPSMEVQHIVIAIAFVLNGAWIVLVSMGVDGFIKRQLERSGTDSRSA